MSWSKRGIVIPLSVVICLVAEALIALSSSAVSLRNSHSA
nr:MAG TPA: hypothetical protein [Caudoviricetes sp.]